MTGILHPDSAGTVRLVRVTRGGSGPGWSALGNAVKNLSPDGFVSIDTEFSGLGVHSSFTDPDLSVRYDALRRVVDSRALLSLGVSVFNLRSRPSAQSAAPCDGVPADGAPTDGALADGAPTDGTPADGAPNDGAPANAGRTPDKRCAQYEVATFDFGMCCETAWTMISDAGRFLVSHNFDFNRMFASGIPYVRASTEGSANSSPRRGHQGRKPQPAKAPKASAAVAFEWGPMPRGLLWRIGRSGVPLVVHNGLLDLALLYSSFHGPLPATLNQFVAKLLEAVPAGFYDTKHLATTVKPERASFLGYVFAKRLQDDIVRVVSSPGLPRPEVAAPDDFRPSGRPHHGDGNQVPPPSGLQQNGAPVGSVGAHSKATADDKKCSMDSICVLFALRGHCPKGIQCQFKHDIFQVLEFERAGGEFPNVATARKMYNKQQKARKSFNLATMLGRSKRPLSEVSGDGEGESQKKKMTKKEMKRALQLHTVEHRSGVSALENVEGPETPVSHGIKVTSGDVAGEHPIQATSGNLEGHCAGWDAYMTGFCFAAIRATAESPRLVAEANKLPLANKRFPLLLCKSSFEELNSAALATSVPLEDKGNGDPKKIIEKSAQAVAEC